MKFVLRLVAGLLATASASFADGGDGIAFFEREIRPLLEARCLECHSTDGKRKGGLLLDSRAGWEKGGDSGAALVPGDASASLLIEAVRYGNRDFQMPPDNRLPAGEVAALERWIAMGAPDPRTGAADHGAPETPSEEAGRAFWSFRPLTAPEVPVVRNTAWVKTPVDAFILAKLEEAGLEPAPVAAPSEWLRRVSFGLIGLPPDLAEQDAFFADTAPDAWERLVERLLDSPQHGVRWGRHWLDVARYADSNGLDENLAFGQAWRYRDYVIDSFNADKPYERFVVEQIAGDLLPEATAETKTATGFLALGARVLAEPDVEKLRMDVIDEQLDTFGKAFLGMTFGCARCHDHKFDPVTQRDYYGMAAIFKSSQSFAATNTGAIKHWFEHPLATPEEEARAKAEDEGIAAKRKVAGQFKSEAIGKLRADARAKAADYLAAAIHLDRASTLGDAAAVAAGPGLHPWILLHGRSHLEYHAGDAFYAPWREMARAGDEEGIRRHYREAFAAAEEAWAALRKEDPKATALADARLEAARSALHDNAGFLAIPSEPAKAFDAATVAELDRLEEEVRALEAAAYDPPSAMGVGEAETVVAELPVHIRGSHVNLGEAAPKAVPAVMGAPEVRPQWAGDRSGRLEMARWLVHPEHPLTARVIVNRVWRWHFGTGLVATTDNFGFTGEAPSHPELLDWLAVRFIESGWSFKELHRLILRSNVHRMSTVHPDPGAAAEIDPENRLHWRFQRQRLEAEALRDAVLAVSGQLDLTLGGKTIPLRNRQFVFNHTSKDHTGYASVRRSVYLPVIRNHVADVLAQFDYPDPTMPTGSRNATVVAPQALFLLNSPLLVDAADAMAVASMAASADPGRRIEWIYRRALGRLPSDEERSRAMQWVFGSGPDQAWPLLCQAVMAGNEFVYLP